MSLEGKTILLTRAHGQNRALGQELEALGATTLEIPTLEIHEPASWAGVDRALRALSDYDWIVFTSANAVDAFSRRSGARSLPKVAVVGTETSRRAKARGIRVDLVPRTFRAEGLLDALPRDLNGQRILLPRGDLAGKELPEALRSRGAEVDPVVVYRTVLPSGGGDRLRTALGSGRIDCVTLTSGSTVRNLVAMLGEGDSSICLDRTSIAVIGPVTRQVVESFGFEVAIEPQEATMPALARAIREHFSG